MKTIGSITSALLVSALFACGAPDEAPFFDVVESNDEDLWSITQGWATRYAQPSGRTWGAAQSSGNPACTIAQNDSTNCYFHGHNGSDTLDMVVKYWVNPQWTSAYDAIVQGLVDAWVIAAQNDTGNGQAVLPWSFQRLTGLTPPAGANVIIQAGYTTGTLSNSVGQYVSIQRGTDCFELSEPSPLNGKYHACQTGGYNGQPLVAATINVDFDSLEAYMFQQGYSANQKNVTRMHVLRHGLVAEIGIGGTNSSANSVTRTTFSKSNPIPAGLTSEEKCRWRGVSDFISNNGQPGETTQLTVSAATCN
jgi:hypothetical protein